MGIPTGDANSENTDMPWEAIVAGYPDSHPPLPFMSAGESRWGHIEIKE